MNETWTQELIGPRIYGNSMYGNSYFGSIEWTDETTTTATWTNLTTAASTWIIPWGISNTVVASAEQGVTSSSVQDDTGDGGTGGYHGNWFNNGNTGESAGGRWCVGAAHDLQHDQ